MEMVRSSSTLSEVWVLPVVIILAAMLLSSCSSCGFPDGPQRMGETAQTWESSDRPFTLKIDMHIERGGFMPAATAGAYYVFYSKSPGSSNWQKIMTFRHDDPIDIPERQVRFVNDSVAYFFIGPFFVVTTNKGESWTTWDAYKAIPDIKCCYYGVIDDAVIQPDGTGKLSLDPQAVPDRPQRETRDFGIQWE
jgi:hypothetical protein